MDVRVGLYTESWAPKNWCFWTAVLRVPWTARRPNQSILEEISPEYLLKGLMLKLKLQYSGYLMRRTTSLEKTLMWERMEAGREGNDRGWDGWMASPTRWTWVWVSSGIGDGQGSLACCIPWGHKGLDMTERLKWTELNWTRTGPQNQLLRISNNLKTCPASFLGEQSASFHFCSPLCPPSEGCWKSATIAAHDLILVEVDGKHLWQVPACGWPDRWQK